VPFSCEVLPSLRETCGYLEARRCGHSLDTYGTRFASVRMSFLWGMLSESTQVGGRRIMDNPLEPSFPKRVRLGRNEILALLRDMKPDLESRFGVRSLALFGSYATGQATGESDVDILVDVDPSIGLRFVTLAETLEDELGLPVDLVSVGGIKPRYREAVEADLIYV
jgi:uncharacterized protein